MAVTNKFNFLLLNGSDAAGHNTINNLINSIESSLEGVSTGLATGADTPGALTTGQVLRWNGSTYAAALVNAASIDTGAVTESKIADGAVTSAKILDGTITTTDLAFDPATQAELDAHAADTTSVHGIADTSALALKSGNTYTGTHDFSGATLTGTVSSASNLTGGAGGSVPYQSAAGTTSMLANGTAGQVLTSNGTTVAPSWQNASIGEANIANNAVTYAKLAADAKTYDVPISGTGVYFTSSGDFTAASLSTASAQNPVVIANHASTTIELSLPNTVGTEGATITVCQTGAASTVIKPKTGATATINGSTSNTYTLGGQYSIVTLLCLSNSGSNGTWVISGDYI